MEFQLAALSSIAALAVFALWRGFLTPRGAASAIVVGSLAILAHVGLFLLLVWFFVTSSLFTKLKADWKKSIGLKDVSGRSLGQVFGVGTPIALFAFLYILTGDVKFLGAAAVAVAVATADTWASEIGVAYGGAPRYILTPWRRVEPGVSGGVTPVGVLASLAGAFTVGVLAQIFTSVDFWKVALLGYVGELLDSVLGAALQIKYICNGAVSETQRAGCVKRGFLTNEAVNLISGVSVGVLFIFL
ncbi:MAG: DUF92 domain-containing protein [Pyrobaculum sp.]